MTRFFARDFQIAEELIFSDLGSDHLRGKRIARHHELHYFKCLLRRGTAAHAESGGAGLPKLFSLNRDILMTRFFARDFQIAEELIFSDLGSDHLRGKRIARHHELHYFKGTAVF